MESEAEPPGTAASGQHLVAGPLDGVERGQSAGGEAAHGDPRLEGELAGQRDG